MCDPNKTRLFSKVPNLTVISVSAISFISLIILTAIITDFMGVIDINLQPNAAQIKIDTRK
ncbi:MAG: hypothetical protein QNJ64_03075 [Crocosphaera sp.]|nr:hypothetical protein [Crocosphaera sp.]